MYIYKVCVCVESAETYRKLNNDKLFAVRTKRKIYKPSQSISNTYR